MSLDAKFKSLGKRVAIKLAVDDVIHGELHEQVSPKTILPQFFAKLESNGQMCDLRNDVYWIVEDERKRA